MTKSDLVEAVASATGGSKASASAAVGAVFDSITGEPQGGNKVTITGFGTFGVSDRAARTGVNPRTGEKIDIAAARPRSSPPDPNSSRPSPAESDQKRRGRPRGGPSLRSVLKGVGGAPPLQKPPPARFLPSPGGGSPSTPSRWERTAAPRPHTDAYSPSGGFATSNWRRCAACPSEYSTSMPETALLHCCTADWCIISLARFPPTLSLPCMKAICVLSSPLAMATAVGYSLVTVTSAPSRSPMAISAVPPRLQVVVDVALGRVADGELDAEVGVPDGALETVVAVEHRMSTGPTPRRGT